MTDTPNSASTWENRWQHAMMNNYGTPPIELTSGSGVILKDSEGNEYIDFLAGIAVNALGQAHPDVVAAVAEQAARLGHTSNLFAHEPGMKLAEKLVERFHHGDGTGKETTRVAFCNSGTEANEMAFKLARLTGRRRILAAVNGFHGRTMGSLTLTGQPAKRDIFGPLPAGVEYFHFNDVEYLEKLIAVQPDQVAAVILEPIQGETGVIPATPEFMTAVRELTSSCGALMICDEVQTGNGRTGTYFSFESYGVLPDIVTTAKGVGAGLPLGACIATGSAAQFFTPGAHGSTFAGNPIATAAGNVLQTKIDEGLLDEVTKRGQKLRTALEALPQVQEVRGAGLMLGAVLRAPIAKKAVAAALRHGVIVNAPSESVLRFTPPLIINSADIACGVADLAEALAEVEAREAPESAES